MLLNLIYAIPLALILIVLVYFYISGRRTGTIAEVPRGTMIYGDLIQEGKVLVTRKHNLSGKPDKIVRHGNLIIPFEYKSGTAQDVPRHTHVLQMGVYFIILGDLYPDYSIDYGILQYSNKRFEIQNTQELRDEVLAKAEVLRRTVGIPVRNHDRPGRCRNCPYLEICRQRLI
ncbi:MAG: Dna2/Cas4 domain-containing protein [Candidatus Thermoplasmatota archaeon]|jgi:CRISPR-associated exonuclease Cas4|nr:Dna2/Cas4 domain-containing protein [Candidatus Thermoplasmatota archaeon]MCL5790683.1 Dna2/Cas4 domain-containing protein [Candidatus Thermoplasmatota archaeon]